MEEIEFVKIGREQLRELVQMARKSFLEAFTEGNKPENVNAYMNEAFTLEQFQSEFENEASTFFVAKLSGKIIDGDFLSRQRRMQFDR